MLQIFSEIFAFISGHMDENIALFTETSKNQSFKLHLKTQTIKSYIRYNL
jgi:hypothetical protein